MNETNEALNHEFQDQFAVNLKVCYGRWYQMLLRDPGGLKIPTAYYQWLSIHGSQYVIAHTHKCRLGTVLWYI